MTTVYRLIGAVVFWAWVLGALDLIDFRVCVGPVSTCSATPSKIARTV